MLVSNEILDKLVACVCIELVAWIGDSGAVCDEFLSVCDSQTLVIFSWSTIGDKIDIHLFKLSFL